MSGAYRVARVSPERLSSGLMTPLRNAHVDLYELDVGSLDAGEFHRLGRPYALSAYDLVRRLLDEYRVRSWCAVVGVGMPGQTKRSCATSLSRLVEWGPAAIRLDVSRCREADEAAACERVAQADEALRAGGYRRVGAFEYAKSGERDGAGAHDGASAGAGMCVAPGGVEPAEYWGFGAGASSLMDGCVVQNTGDLGSYLGLAGEGSSGEIPCRVTRLSDRAWACVCALHGLQAVEGMDLHAFEERYGAGLRSVLDELARQGLAQASPDGRLTLSWRGVARYARVVDLLDQAQGEATEWGTA